LSPPTFETWYLHHVELAHNNRVTENSYGHQWKETMELYHTFAVHAQPVGYTNSMVGKYLTQYHHTENTNSVNADATIPPGWDYWLGLEFNSRYYNYTVVEMYPGLDQPRIHRHDDKYPNDYLPLVMQRYNRQSLSNDTARNETTTTKSGQHLLSQHRQQLLLLNKRHAHCCRKVRYNLGTIRKTVVK
jgi:hypothetical protein